MFAIVHAVCPKSDPSIAPDTYQQMQRSLIDKLHDDLKKLNIGGSIALCGYETAIA